MAALRTSMLMTNLDSRRSSPRSSPDWEFPPQQQPHLRDSRRLLPCKGLLSFYAISASARSQCRRCLRPTLSATGGSWHRRALMGVGVDYSMSTLSCGARSILSGPTAAQTSPSLCRSHLGGVRAAVSRWPSMSYYCNGREPRLGLYDTRRAAFIVPLAGALRRPIPA